MSAEQLLARLENVKRTGAGRWVARCPAHDDRAPSLSVRELDDGRTLVHCFGGCDVESVLANVDLEMAALFPLRAIQHGERERRPFPAADVLRCVSFEALVVSMAAESLAQGQALLPSDLDRLRLAAARLQAAREVFHD